MSKKTTRPPFEDYKAPWEVDSTGADVPADQQQIDGARLKKYLWNLLGDKVALEEQVESVTTERDTLKTQLDEKAREGETDSDKVKREREEAIEAARNEGKLDALKLEVALDIDGITPAQAKRLAKRLTGTTEEELKADAKAIAEDFGLGKPQGDDEGDGEDGGDEPLVPSRRPRVPRLGGSSEPGQTSLPKADLESVDKLFPR